MSVTDLALNLGNRHLCPHSHTSPATGKPLSYGTTDAQQESPLLIALIMQEGRTFG